MDGVQFTNALIVGSESLSENSAYVRDVEPSLEHLFDVRPVLASVVEALKTARSLQPGKGALCDQLMLPEMEA